MSVKAIQIASVEIWYEKKYVVLLGKKKEIQREGARERENRIIFSVLRWQHCEHEDEVGKNMNQLHFQTVSSGAVNIEQ